ncbi:MAG TPA: hypothetical protein PLP63_06920 [Saprospiraceae bacterium]|nr:hypothetical protein [Saprospiraceae bacterium]
MSKYAYQKLIDEAVFQLKCCLSLCTQLLNIPISETPLVEGDYVLVRTDEGCFLKAYTPIGIVTLSFHDNFNALNIALPQPGQPVDAIVAVRNSQGTSWLPGPLGGTWYPKGYYRSTGLVWEFFGEFSYQATQAAVDAGLINDQFVTPFTFENAAKWNTKHAAIQFKDEGVSLGSAGTVNEIDFTGAGVTATRVGNKITLLVTGSSLIDGDYGDITISGGGTILTIDNGLSATVIGDGSVSNTEFQYINSLSSNAQDQIDTKMDTNLGIAMAIAL